MYITTPWGGIISEGFTVTQSVKITRVSKEPEDSVPYLDNPAVRPYLVFISALTSCPKFSFNITVLSTANLIRVEVK
jgi:hypothetical protein